MINKEFMINTMYKDFISKYFINNYDFKIERNKDNLMELVKTDRHNLLHIHLYNDCFELAIYSCYDDCQVSSDIFYYREFDTLQKLTDLITDLECFIRVFNKYFNIKTSD